MARATRGSTSKKRTDGLFCNFEKETKERRGTKRREAFKRKEEGSRFHASETTNSSTSSSNHSDNNAFARCSSQTTTKLENSTAECSSQQRLPIERADGTTEDTGYHYCQKGSKWLLALANELSLPPHRHCSASNTTIDIAFR